MMGKVFLEDLPKHERMKYADQFKDEKIGVFGWIVMIAFIATILLNVGACIGPFIWQDFCKFMAQ